MPGFSTGLKFGFGRRATTAKTAVLASQSPATWKRGSQVGRVFGERFGLNWVKFRLSLFWKLAVGRFF